MKKAYAFALSMVLVLALTSGSALAAGDPAKGKKLFKKCAVCHALTAGDVAKGKKKLGPYLGGVVGRQAASVEGYKYSRAFKKLDYVWNEMHLDAYLANPKKHVKGTRMIFPGFKKKQDREDIIAYLKTATQ
jgi:cytochrome c